MAGVEVPLRRAMRDNRDQGRFEIEEAGLVVFADYRRREGQIIIDHVEAPPALRGSGAAGRLMAEIVRQAKAERARIIPLCGYAAAWLKRNAGG